MQGLGEQVQLAQALLSRQICDYVAEVSYSYLPYSRIFIERVLNT